MPHIYICSACIDAESGRYVAWMRDNPKTFVISYTSETDAVGQLVHQLPEIEVINGLFEITRD